MFKNPISTTSQRISIRHYARALLAAWTLLVAGSLGWNLWYDHQDTLKEARLEANASFNKDLTYRLWVSKEGGVYVPDSLYTPPNPHLAGIAERDVTTTSGRKLTLVNPSYMTRQVMELGQERFGLQGHITSLKPIRPENGPDSWETAALKSFENGNAEASDIAKIGGQPYLRLMRPFRTEESCLRCHASQGYKVGDVRGGLSVSIPMTAYRHHFLTHAAIMALSHLLFYIVVAAGLVLGARQFEARLVENQKAQDALALFRELVDQSNDSVFIFAADGRILDCNAQAAQALGYNKAEMLALTVHALEADPPRPDAWAQLVQTLKETGGERRERLYRRRDGSTLPVEVNKRHLVRGTQEYIVAIARDITRRQQAERELKQYREHLEEMVQRRTAELAEARDQAQAASRAKSLFLANMSHELRTPLTAVLGFSELLRRDQALAPTSREHLEIILKSGEHLLELINNVLDFSKIEAGHMKIVPQDFELAKPLGQVISMMQGKAQAKGLGLRLETASGTPERIHSDPGILRQVLINLLGNAVKFTQKGEIVLRAAPGKEAGWLEFEVRDTGIGIARQDLERILLPFEQANRLSTGGTGLGLTITRHQVQMLGGTLTVESETGQGSVFRIALPVGTVVDPAPSSEPGRN